ncbi:MAG: glycosyltransferase family 4 protein [Bacteroidales bacterium]|nr:glycosyltransferase family 4 protein [Bacteroidales bacterium]
MGVVRNLPYRKPAVYPQKLLKKGYEKIIIYQGSVNVGRGLERMIEAMRYIENAHFVIVGEGDILSELEKKVKDDQLSDKVTFMGRIPVSALHYYTVEADLGISLEENLGLNYYYALPNKLFDYIQARVPVLVSDFPEMAEVVNRYKIGRTTLISDPKQLAVILHEMLTDEGCRESWKLNLQHAADELCWENEENKLFDLLAI